jgi:retron-type reverse transcriptase
MDYTEPVTATAAQHIENIKGLIEDLCKNYDIDLLLENLNVLEECKRVINELNKRPRAERVTLEYNDGLEVFTINGRIN